MHAAIDRANDMTQLWLTCAQMSADVPVVVTLRILGASGLWSVPKGEHHDMIAEKAPAFIEAMLSCTLTAWAGRGPDRMMQAAVEPLSRKARANRMRLVRRGPRAPFVGPPLTPPFNGAFDP